jgi:hypothetical protein
MARMEFATKGKEEKMELSSRLDKFLEIRKQNIGAKRAEVVKEKMIKGAKIGAKFAAAGWIFRDLIAPFMHTGGHSTIIEGAKKIFSEVQADELPPLPTPGEEAVRDILLTNLRKVAPLTHEHLPAAAMPPEHLAGAVGVEINPAGYQGGHSIWQEGAKQLEHHYDQFKHLNKNSQNFDINRLKNAVAADPEKFGLPKNVDINKVTADDLKNVRWNEAMREIFGPEKKLGEKINNLHEVLSQHGKHVIPFKGRGAPLPEKIIPSREILPEHPADNIVKQNNIPAEDSFTKVAQDIKNAAPAVPEQAPAITGPSWHRPSLGYQNIHHAPPAENIAASGLAVEPSGMHLHETVLENPNVGPDYAVIKPEEHFVDFKAAERLAQQPGDLDLHNVKTISYEALNALQSKTGGAIYLNGLDSEKITDNDVLQSLSELRKNVHVVMQDSMARQVDNWEINAGEYQQDWSVDSQHVPAAQDWHVDDQHVPTAEPPNAEVDDNSPEVAAQDWRVDSQHVPLAQDWHVDDQHVILKGAEDAPAAPEQVFEHPANTAIHEAAKPEISHGNAEVSDEGNNMETMTTGNLRGSTGEENLNMQEVYKVTTDPDKIEGIKMDSKQLSILGDELMKHQDNPHSEEARKIISAIKQTVEMGKKFYGTDKIYSDNVLKIASLEK